MAATTRAACRPSSMAAAPPFGVWNRNKRSIALDLKKPEDVATVRALAARADVLVENFRPGTLDRLGLGYEVLQRRQPAADLVLHLRLRPDRALGRRMAGST